MKYEMHFKFSWLLPLHQNEIHLNFRERLPPQDGQNYTAEFFRGGYFYNINYILLLTVQKGLNQISDSTYRLLIYLLNNLLQRASEYDWAFLT